ncbi:MAG: hypothetical protein VKJ64_00380, partial [Leptolyngbyaceae bacterium]|nr:hypothetical protein [Leptolyngbyaceae bacterium]
MEFPPPELSRGLVDESMLLPDKQDDRSQEYILAAIDVGTNSFHLVVVKIQPHLPAFKIVTQEK